MTDSAILVIEHNNESRQLAVELLDYAGFAAIEAATAADGLRMIRKHMPCAIILDIALPDFDGLQLMAVLRGNRATRKIPVIAIAEITDSYEREELEEAGFAGFVHKPVQIDGFIEVVSAVAGPGVCVQAGAAVG